MRVLVRKLSPQTGPNVHRGIRGRAAAGNLGRYDSPIETGRLILEPWVEADWLELRPIATDPRVMRYITGGIAWTDDQIRDFVARQIRHFDEFGYCRWKIREKKSPGLLGFCGVGMLRGVADPEIGWWLAANQWGQGIATEAARCALADAIERAGLRAIVSVADADNEASIRIMRKLGLRFEKHFDHFGKPSVLYAIRLDDER